MIGIIGAMEEEVAAIKEYMTITKTTQVLDCVFYEGVMEGSEIVLLQGGIGKVNATICTTLLLTKYNIDYIINIGSAGGLHLTQEVGDVVLSTDVIHHDVDVTAFGRSIGEVPGLPKQFLADEMLLSKCKEIFTTLDKKVHIGTIVSGDQFISQKQQVETIKTNFPEALCAEMEAAAIGQSCYKFSTPFIVIRSLSDVFNKGDSSIQFDEYLKVASASSASMCKTLVKELKNV